MALAFLVLFCHQKSTKDKFFRRKPLKKFLFNLTFNYFVLKFHLKRNSSNKTNKVNNNVNTGGWQDGVYYWIEKNVYGEEYYQNDETELYIEVQNNSIIRGFKTIWNWDEAGESIIHNTNLIISGNIEKKQITIYYFAPCGCSDQDCQPCEKVGDECCEQIEKIDVKLEKAILNPKNSKIKSSKFLKIENSQYYKLLKNKLYESIEYHGNFDGKTKIYASVLDLYFKKYENK